MTLRKRRKSSRYAGTKTHGRGRKNRTRGLGNRGGKGMSGSGKRGDAKKTLVIHLYGNSYFGKDARGQGLKEKKRTPSLSLRSVIAGLNGFVKKGVAKHSKEGYDIDLSAYKIIGSDLPPVALKIKAKAASSGAQEAVKKAGGEITINESPKL